MNTQLQKLRNDFIQKVEKLEEIKSTLLTEFVGIDTVIEDIINNVRAWYTMSSIQDRPAIINLWGLTGVGKTSLLQRLMELLEFSDRTYRIDLGVKDGNMSFRNTLSDLCDNKDDSPIVIMLDEFQHARSLKGNGFAREEVENDKTRMVWELIDSGKVSYIDWKTGLWQFEDLILKLKKLSSNGVKVSNGLITDGLDLYIQEMDICRDDNKPIPFIPKDEYATIIELAGEALHLPLKQDVERALMKLNAKASIDFLFNVFRLAQSPTIKNFSKSLIFIIGNIDEAYTMSSNFSSDISADEFYQQSLKITIPDMKGALRNRFRDEQIARLGNTHIIYPALSASAYKEIIDIHLAKISQKLYNQFEITMTFDNSVKEILYKEGVYPTQGARPLLTTIQSMIGSRLSIYLNRILKHQLNTDRLHLFMVEETQLTCQFFEKGKLKFTYADTVQLSLENLRKPKNDEMQAICAVHESGHAVLSCALLHSIPQLVVSVSADTDAEGFVYYNSTKDYYAKHELVSKTAVFLGGLAAEEYIFGKENITSGASSDLANATSFVMRMLKFNGMGEKQINYAKTDSQETLAYHATQDVEEEVALIFAQAKQLALLTLEKERELLLVLANILNNKTRIEKSELQQLVLEHCQTNILNPTKSTFYREKLKAQIADLYVVEKLGKVSPVQLNKDEN